MTLSGSSPLSLSGVTRRRDGGASLMMKEEGWMCVCMRTCEWVC